jgi:cysteine-S-conjugate beta-lyase
MFACSVGPIALEVEHRAPGSEGGPTLRIRRPGDGRELLRFDCFARGAHWHLDPPGRDAITPIGPALDAIDWTLAELRRDLPGLVARAGGPSLDASPAELEAALGEVERALRHPPYDFDAVDPETKRGSRGEKWTVYPPEALPLWVADMDFPVAEPIRRVLQRAVDTSDLGYPIHPRPTDLAAIFAARLRDRFGFEVDPRSVELVSEVVQGVYVGLLQLSEPGDGVVVQTPIYSPFFRAVEETGRALRESPLALGPAGYEVDLDALRRAASGARVLLLCHPHNPTGRVFRRAELEAIAEVVVANDLVVLSDEIHADLVLSGPPFVPFASIAPELAARTVTFMSASKSFNIAGLRCAVAFFGSDALRRRFLGLPRHVRGGINILGLEASRAAWLHGEPWLDAALGYLRGNRDWLASFVASSLPGVRHHPPEATYLAWLDCRELALEPTPFRFFLERARVATSDGAVFGRPGEGFVRVNFATSRRLLTEALERMAKALHAGR